MANQEKDRRFNIPKIVVGVGIIAVTAYIPVLAIPGFLGGTALVFDGSLEGFGSSSKTG